MKDKINEDRLKKSIKYIALLDTVVNIILFFILSYLTLIIPLNRLDK